MSSGLVVWCWWECTEDEEISGAGVDEVDEVEMGDAIELGFKSPVRFWFFCLFWNNCDCDRSQKIPEMEKTGLNHL